MPVLNFFYGFLSFVFLGLFGLKYYFFLQKAGGFGIFILDALHFGSALLVVFILRALSNKGKWFRLHLALPLVFLLFWAWFAHWSHPLRDNPPKIAVVFLDLLESPFINPIGPSLPKDWGWGVILLCGLVYWSWLGWLFETFLFNPWKKWGERKSEANPQWKTIVFYRFTLVMAIATMVGTALFHTLTWPLWNQSPEKLNAHTWLAIPLFFMIWLPFFIKGLKDGTRWKRMNFKDGPILKKATWVISVYCIFFFLSVFFYGFVKGTIVEKNGQYFYKDRGVQSYTAEATREEYLKSQMRFMRGWSAFLIFFSFMAAKQTWYEIRYLEGHGKPVEEKPTPEAPPSSPPDKRETITPFQIKSALLETKGDIEVTVPPSYKLRAVPYVVFSFTPLAIPFVLLYFGRHESSWFLYLAFAFTLVIALGLVAPPIIYAYFCPVAAILSPRGLWMVELGWVNWDEIKCLWVTRRPGENNVGIVPKDWAAMVSRVPWHYKIHASVYQFMLAMAQQQNGTSATYKIASYPWTGLSVSGEDFVKYAEKQGVRTGKNPMYGRDVDVS